MFIETDKYYNLLIKYCKKIQGKETNYALETVWSYYLSLHFATGLWHMNLCLFLSAHVQNQGCEIFHGK